MLLLSDITARGIDPLSLRLVILENKYRSQMDLTWDSIDAAFTTLKRWRKKVDSWGSSLIVKKDDEIFSSLMNDLDTPKAIQRLRTIEKDSLISDEMKRAIFMYADQVLALDLGIKKNSKSISAQCAKLLEERNIARQEKNWAKSDLLRDQLMQEGIIVSDTSSGQEWDLI